MYVTAPMRGSSSLRKRRAPTAAPAYQAENVRRVIERVAEETGDAALRQSLHFSTGVVDRITRQMQLGCTVVTDSKYVYDGVTKGWAQGWRRRGWRKADGNPALNPDLWQQLLDLLEQHEVTFNWVKGHAGHPENERCDRLAVAQSMKYK